MEVLSAQIIYTELLALLQAARGQNKYRGRQENLRKELRIRLEVQPRASQKAGQTLVLMIEEGRAYYHAATGFVYSNQFECLEAFLDAALALCRGGGQFIETYESRTTYK